MSDAAARPFWSNWIQSLRGGKGASADTITGPLPVIAGAKLSLPADLGIAIRKPEFPAGYTLNALLDVRNFQRTSVLRLRCADGVGGEAGLERELREERRHVPAGLGRDLLGLGPRARFPDGLVVGGLAQAAQMRRQRDNRFSRRHRRP